MLVDKQTNVVVMVGLPGQLQFYDVCNDTHVFSLDITGENYISPENLSQPIPMSRVDHMAMTSDSHWLVTSQLLSYGDGDDEDGEVVLKFWGRKVEHGNYELNTSIKQPHRGRIASLTCRNAGGSTRTTTTTMMGVMFVTSSPSDKSFITWEPSQHEGRIHWTPVFVGTYMKLAPSICRFSYDSSVLCVVFERQVTLWDVDEGRMLMCCCYLKEEESFFRSVEYGQMFNSNTIYLSTNSELICWTPRPSEIWTTPLDVTTMICEPGTERIIAFTSMLQIHIYSTTNNQPMRVYDSVSTSPVVAACISHNQLIFLNVKQELLMLKKKEDVVEGGMRVKLSKKLDADYAPFAALLSQSAATNSNSRNPATETTSKRGIMDIKSHAPYEFYEKLKHTPNHALPPLKSWSLSFIQSFINKRKVPRKLNVRKLNLQQADHDHNNHDDDDDKKHEEDEKDDDDEDDDNDDVKMETNQPDSGSKTITLDVDDDDDNDDGGAGDDDNDKEVSAKRKSLNSLKLELTRNANNNDDDDSDDGSDDDDDVCAVEPMDM